MNSNALMDVFAKLTEFLSYVCGSDYEIVLHDIESPEASIAAIEHGDISGRSLEGPMSDLALKMLRGKYYETNDYVVNRGATRDGKVLASSTFFIKDEAGKLIGMLCVNHDLTSILGFSNNLLETLASFGVQQALPQNGSHSNGDAESLEKNVEDLMGSIYRKAMGSINVPPERMSAEEKMEVVAALEGQGYFLLKGAVPEVAKLLKVSEATIYRYLNKNGK